MASPLAHDDTRGGGSHGEMTLAELEEVLAGSCSTAGCLGGDPRSVMALEYQVVVHVRDGLRVHPFELDGGKIAPGNRPGPKHVPDDHTVAVSIDAAPKGPHRDPDRHRRQQQKQWKPPPLVWALRRVSIDAE